VFTKSTASSNNISKSDGNEYAKKLTFANFPTILSTNSFIEHKPKPEVSDQSNMG